MSIPLARKPIVPRRPVPGPSRPGGRVGTNAKGTEGDSYLYVAGVRDPSKRVTEFRAENDSCPLCKTDRQFNKNLRLLVSPCYHKMCESCIDRLFTLGPEPCPFCGRILRKVNFAHQTFEDLKVEKEVAVRRRMATNFNKRRDDFESDREYDDYLEEVEDLTFNLLNDIDTVKTEARIAEFAAQNATLIANNAEKTALESLTQQERDEREREERESRRRLVEEHEEFERVEEERVKKEIVEALASDSQHRANEIMRQATRAKKARLEAFTTVHKPLTNLDSTSTNPLSPRYDGPYVPIPYSDPKVPWYEMKEFVDVRKDVRWVRESVDKVRGGGWDLGLFWEMEVRSAVEGLGVEPL